MPAIPKVDSAIFVVVKSLDIVSAIVGRSVLVLG